ncbi:MAG TPA: translation initiation factor IF-3 [Gaiellales bacterium]|nr:translation initiation factor IF-3 [Gaiellales bacterium]
MRPRRQLDQRPQEPTTRINEGIRVPQVRLIDSDGAQIGIKSTDDALKYAWDKNLDLVEVAPDARPPVCRVMDYSKYRYEQEQKAKLARKHQSTITIKEIKLRPKIGQGDYNTKKGHVVRFLKNRAKVKVTIMFRGREMTHPERGRDLLLRLAEDVKDLGTIESQPLQDGRNMVMMLAPHKAAPAKPAEVEADASAAAGA